MNSEFAHRKFKTDEFWKKISGWEDVHRNQFNDHRWQISNTITNVKQLHNALKARVTDSFIKDVEARLNKASMTIRITPYIFSLIDWSDPYEDPLRKQYLPVFSELQPEHPFASYDSLYEEPDSPVRHLTHRYSDRALILLLNSCPHYCCYCNRSRTVGKAAVSPSKKDLTAILNYIHSHPEIEDVILSGGDIALAQPESIRFIGKALLEIEHIRRLRLATKSLAVFPMKILTDDEWFGAVREIHSYGKTLNKQVYIHTHFSTKSEISEWSLKASKRLFSEGILVRNQAVFQHSVNHKTQDQTLLGKQLSYMNIQPYYLFLPDMVPGIEHLRVTLQDGIDMEKALRGTNAGFNIPTIACDLPGGGGKRHVTSFEYYNKESGISVWQAPAVKPEKAFLYFDPIHRLSPETQKRWQDPREISKMLNEAISNAPTGLRVDRQFTS